MISEYQIFIFFKKLVSNQVHSVDKEVLFIYLIRKSTKLQVKSKSFEHRFARPKLSFSFAANRKGKNPNNE